MQRKTLKSAISRADYKLLQDFDAAQKARLKCFKEDSLSNSSNEHFGSQLSAQEQTLLTFGGAVVGSESEELEVVKGFVYECRRILETSLDQQSVASMLKISTETVSVMTCSQPPELNSFSLTNSPSFYPAWQFCTSETIPHLAELLSRVSPSAHVISLSRFMLTRNSDLEHPDSGHLFSPRRWLVEGYDPDPVMLMASEI